MSTVTASNQMLEYAALASLALVRWAWAVERRPGVDGPAPEAIAILVAVELVPTGCPGPVLRG
jgi:hypothetical protein